MSEIQIKLDRLGKFLDRHQLDGVLLTRRNNFAWITGGRNNFIPNNGESGVASIYATRDQRICLANSIELPRFRDEELLGTGINCVSFPWYHKAAQTRAVREIVGDGKIAADSETFGLDAVALPGDFAELRWSLTPEEIERFKEGGRRTSAAMEQACAEIRPGMAEHQIAGVLSQRVHDHGMIPVVNLIAVDDRVDNFRHPIPTETVLKSRAMLVICAEYGGLISNMTRFVSFGPLDEQFRLKQQAVLNIEAAVYDATKPGRTLGSIFEKLTRAYADNGFADQWKYHHQGGSAGYLGREAFADPDSTVIVHDNQAFAWNPSVPGYKSEDTYLLTPRGWEMITTASEDWPKQTGRSGNFTMARPDVLIR